MKINTLGKNQTEIRIGNKTVFYSYNTPVAAEIDGKYYRTEQYYSSTTARHINNWLNGITAESKPQEFFDNIE